MIHDYSTVASDVRHEADLLKKELDRPDNPEKYKEKEPASCEESGLPF